MPFKLLQCLRAVAVVVSFAASVPAAHAAAIYDNLGASRDGSDPLFGFGPLADSFRTGAAGGWLLSGIDALLTNGSSSLVGNVQVSLHADSGNAPGASLGLLGVLSSADVSTAAFGAYRFAPATALLLAANTTYWIEMLASSPNAIEWSWSNDLASPGVAGQFNYSATLGTSSNSSFGPYQLRVGATQVPEPASVSLVFAGLALLVAMSRRHGKR